MSGGVGKKGTACQHEVFIIIISASHSFPLVSMMNGTNNIFLMTSRDC